MKKIILAFVFSTIGVLANDVIKANQQDLAFSWVRPIAPENKHDNPYVYPYNVNQNNANQENSKTESKKQKSSEIGNARIFLGVQMSAGFDSGIYVNKTSQESYKRIPISIFGLVGGLEWIFDKSGNGLNISAEQNLFSSFVQARYVYESQKKALKYALLSGFDAGYRFAYGDNNILRTYYANGFLMDYELGFRLRIYHHGIFFNLKIPLFEIKRTKQVLLNDLNTLDKKDFSKDLLEYAPMQTTSYPIELSVSYIYFF